MRHAFEVVGRAVRGSVLRQTRSERDGLQVGDPSHGSGPVLRPCDQRLAQFWRIPSRTARTHRLARRGALKRDSGDSRSERASPSLHRPTDRHGESAKLGPIGAQAAPKDPRTGRVPPAGDRPRATRPPRGPPRTPLSVRREPCTPPRSARAAHPGRRPRTSANARRMAGPPARGATGPVQGARRGRRRLRAGAVTHQRHRDDSGRGALQTGRRGGGWRWRMGGRCMKSERRGGVCGRRGRLARALASGGELTASTGGRFTRRHRRRRPAARTRSGRRSPLPLPQQAQAPGQDALVRWLRRVSARQASRGLQLPAACPRRR